LKITIDVTEAGVTEAKIKQKNCYHFRSMAILGFNDLIFRKRLMNSSWFFRKKVLTELKNFFAKGRQFQDFETDKDTASLKRDYILMFGSKAEVQARLEKETKYLPLNQKTKHHEMYALIVELSELYQNILTPTVSSNFKETEASLRAKELKEAYEFIEANTPEITPEWSSCTIQNGKKIGRDFAVSSRENADKSYEDIASCLEKEEKGEKISDLLNGYRALGFLEIDPLLSDPKIIAQEKELIIQILRGQKLGEPDTLESEEEEIAPNVQDFLDVIKKEKEENM